MVIPRIYQPIELADQTEISLDPWGTRHIKALRLCISDDVVLFNGDDTNYFGKVISIESKTVKIKLVGHEISLAEPSLVIHLFQAISRSERMDYTIQKATELGVTSITPIISERCEIRLSTDRLQKRQEHWQQIAISACEQTGRTGIPSIHFPQSLAKTLEELRSHSLALILDPEGTETLASLNTDFDKKPESIIILVGPEGGLTATEIALAKQKGFKGIRLGRRILRTETAGPTMLAALHARWGDFIL